MNEVISNVDLTLNFKDLGLAPDTLLSVEVVGSYFRSKFTIEVQKPYVLELKEGDYLVRIFMPSGEIICEQTSIISGEHNILNVAYQDSNLISRCYLGNKPLDDHNDIASEFPGTWQRLWTYSEKSWQVQDWPSEYKPSKNKGTISYELRVPSDICYLQIGGDKIARRLISLPPSARIKVLIYSTHGKNNPDNDLAMSVVSDSSRSETLLSYMEAGLFDAAKIIVDEIFKEKSISLLLDDPLLGSIVGYYLLQVETSSNYFDWVDEFVGKYEWLPDALVIKAWKSLRTLGNSNKGLIRQNILDSLQRGVPIYTKGLKLLTEGLELFKGDALSRDQTDSEVENALQDIRKYYTASDWFQPLTTFYGDSPQSPSLKLLTGSPERREGLIWLTPEIAKPTQGNLVELIEKREGQDQQPRGNSENKNNTKKENIKPTQSNLVEPIKKREGQDQQPRENSKSKNNTKKENKEKNAGYQERIVQIRRVSKVVKGGKKLSFRAIVVIGDEKGQVGVGVGKASDVIGAVRKGVADGKKHIINVPLTKSNTIPHRIVGEGGGANVMMRPAAPGTGVIAGGAVRAVLELAGVKNILAKQLVESLFA
jgi:small subunit ribosomal protein S5